MTDKIIFSGMEFYAYHGVFPEENRLGQTFIVDVEVYMDLRQAGCSDQLEDTLNYADLYKLVQHIMEERSYHLVESLTERTATHILERFPLVHKVKVRVTKPTPPIPGHYKGVAVEIERSRLLKDDLK